MAIKIKKKPEWSAFRPPDKPSKPIAPKQTSVKREWVTVYSSGCEIELRNVPVPTGMALTDLSVFLDRYSVSSDRSEDYSELEVGFFKETVVENKNYKKNLERYLLDVKKYEDEKPLYNKELECWKAWREQVKTFEGEQKIEWAKKILRTR